MIKKETFILCTLGIMLLTLPIIAYPKLIKSNPTEFPTLNTIYKMEANLKSSKNVSSTDAVSVLELQELIKGGSSESVKAGFVLSSPFGALAVKMNEWISNSWNSNPKKETKI